MDRDQPRWWSGHGVQRFALRRVAGIALVVTVTVVSGCGSGSDDTAGSSGREVVEAISLFPGSERVDLRSERLALDGQGTAERTVLTLRVPNGARTADIDAFYARELAGWIREPRGESHVYTRSDALLTVSGSMRAGGPPQIHLAVVTGLDPDAGSQPDGAPPAPQPAPQPATPPAPQPATPPSDGAAVEAPAASSRLPRCPVRERVPTGWIVALGVAGDVLTIPRRGSGGCTLTRLAPGVSPVSVDLAPDRRHVAIGTTSQGEPAIIETTVAQAGRFREVARPATSPTFAPDGRLAYTELAYGLDITFKHAIVVRDATGRERARIAYPEWSIVSGPPAEEAAAWSPDGRRLVLVERDATIVAADAERTADGTPLRTSSPSDPRAGRLAPVFLNDDTVIAMAGCCVGETALTAIDLATGDERTLTALDSPVEHIDVDHATGDVALVTANDRTLSVWDGRTLRRVRTGIRAAAL